MARLGGENNVTNSLVILSSDDDDEEEKSSSKNLPKSKVNTTSKKQKSRDVPGTSKSSNEDREIPADFMWLMKTFRKYLEEKDERKCNILGLMYKKATPALTLSRGFKSFVEDVMIEIGRGRNDRESILNLLTAVCQSLAVGEILWDPSIRTHKKYKNYNSKDIKPETKKQCDAVKKLLFQGDPPSSSASAASKNQNKKKKDNTNGISTTNKGKVTPKQTINNQNNTDKIKIKIGPKGKSTTTGLDKKKANENSEGNGSIGTRPSFSGGKNRHVSKGPTLVPVQPQKAPELAVQDPYITDLSTEASNIYPAVHLPVKHTQSATEVAETDEASNIIELDDFDMATIVTNDEEMEVADEAATISSGSSSPNPAATNFSSMIDIDITDAFDDIDSNELKSQDVNQGKQPSNIGKPKSHEKSSLKELEKLIQKTTEKTTLILPEKCTQNSLNKSMKKQTDGLKSPDSKSKISDKDDKDYVASKKVVKSSPLNTPLKKPAESRRSTFLKAVEKVKEDTAQQPINVDLLATTNKDKEKTASPPLKNKRSERDSIPNMLATSNQNNILIVPERSESMIPSTTSQSNSPVASHTAPPQDVLVMDNQLDTASRAKLLDMCYVYEIKRTEQNAQHPIAVNTKKKQKKSNQAKKDNPIDHLIGKDKKVVNQGNNLKVKNILKKNLSNRSGTKGLTGLNGEAAKYPAYTQSTSQSKPLSNKNISQVASNPDDQSSQVMLVSPLLYSPSAKKLSKQVGKKSSSSKSAPPTLKPTSTDVACVILDSSSDESDNEDTAKDTTKRSAKDSVVSGPKNVETSATVVSSETSDFPENNIDIQDDSSSTSNSSGEKNITGEDVPPTEHETAPTGSNEGQSAETSGDEVMEVENIEEPDQAKDMTGVNQASPFKSSDERSEDSASADADVHSSVGHVLNEVVSSLKGSEKNLSKDDINQNEKLFEPLDNTQDSSGDEVMEISDPAEDQAKSKVDDVEESDVQISLSAAEESSAEAKTDGISDDITEDEVMEISDPNEKEKEILPPSKESEEMACRTEDAESNQELDEETNNENTHGSSGDDVTEISDSSKEEDQELNFATEESDLIPEPPKEENFFDNTEESSGDEVTEVSVQAAKSDDAEVITTESLQISKENVATEETTNMGMGGAPPSIVEPNQEEELDRNAEKEENPKDDQSAKVDDPCTKNDVPDEVESMIEEKSSKGSEDCSDDEITEVFPAVIEEEGQEDLQEEVESLALAGWTAPNVGEAKTSEEPDDSSGDEVTEVCDPNEIKKNELEPEEPPKKEDASLAEKTSTESKESFDDEVTEVSDPNEMNKDETEPEESAKDKDYTSAEKTSTESKDSSEDEVTEVCDPNEMNIDETEPEESAKNKDNSLAEKTSMESKDSSGDEDVTEVCDPNEMNKNESEPKESAKKEDSSPPEKTSAESKDSTKIKEVPDIDDTPAVKDKTELTLTMDAVTEKELEKTKELSSTEPNESSAENMDSEVTEDCLGDEITEVPVLIESEQDDKEENTAMNDDEDTSKDKECGEVPDKLSKPSKRSIFDIANDLKKKAVEREEDEIKIIEPPSAAPPSDGSPSVGRKSNEGKVDLPNFNGPKSKQVGSKQTKSQQQTGPNPKQPIKKKLNQLAGSKPDNTVGPKSGPITGPRMNQSKGPNQPNQPTGPKLVQPAGPKSNQLPSNIKAISSSTSNTSNSSNTNTSSPPGSQGGGVILIGDDSDDERPVKSAPQPKSNSTPTKNNSRPLIHPGKAAAAGKSNQSKVAKKKVSITTLSTNTNMNVVKHKQPPKKPMLSKIRPTSLSTSTVTSSSILSKPSTPNKNKSKTLNKTPTYVSNILSKETSTSGNKSAENDGSNDGKEALRLTTKESKIRQLENILERLERRINRYASKELSFKDLHSEESAYMMEARAKERYLYHWKLYCKLTGEDPDEVVSARKKVKVRSSPFPHLNNAVEKYINRADIFPNLFEIKQVCAQANLKYKLDIKDTDLHHCAVDIFSEVGRKLQKRREKEFRMTSGNILTDLVNIADDPARHDDSLKRKLKQNKKLAKQRTDDVFKDFVRKQYEQAAGEEDGSGGSDSDDSSQNESMIRNSVSESSSDSESENSQNEKSKQKGNLESDSEDDNSDAKKSDESDVEDAKNSDESGVNDVKNSEESNVDDTNNSDDESEINDVKRSDESEDNSENEFDDGKIIFDDGRKTKRKIRNEDKKDVKQNVKKKKRVDKTVISLTLSSSQEIAEQTGSKQIDYQVTIGTTPPKIKTKTKSHTPISPNKRGLTLLQSKSKNYNNYRNISNETVRSKDKDAATSVEKPSQLASSSVKRKRQSSEKNETGPSPSTNKDRGSSSESDFKKPKTFSKAFSAKKKVVPSFVSSKDVLGEGESKNTEVPAKYIPIVSSKKLFDSPTQSKPTPSLSKDTSTKSAPPPQTQDTIVLDDD